MATAKATARTQKKVRANEGTRGGFTIIEVVLVLAIAGLIFLMVFVALPQMQAAQRDTQRRSDVGRFASALTQYQANNNGKLPADATAYNAMITKYVVGDFVEPSTGNTYTVVTSEYPGDSAALGTIYIVTSKKCGDDGAVLDANGARNYAALLKLEQGVYCVDNS